MPSPRQGLTYIDKILVPLNERQQIGCGLVNYKNNCFFNSVIQALFLECLEENVENHVDCVTCCVRDTNKEMKLSSKTRILWNLYNLLKKRNMSILNGKQQDAHEFLIMLFDKMNVPQHSSSLRNVFNGKVTSSLTCPCKVTSETTTSFVTLEIPIFENSNVNSALKKYFSDESVTFKCDNCNSKVTATKRFTIATAAILLILQLSRFPYAKEKATNVIRILKTIDLSPYLREKIPKLEYHLVAIVNHKETDLDQGHYTSIIKSSGPWYEFDDRRVFRIPSADDNFNSEDAYILFYEMVNNAKGSTENLVEYGGTDTESLHISLERTADMPDEFIPVDITDDAEADVCELVPVEIIDGLDEWIPVEIIDDEADTEEYTPVEVVDDMDAESVELITTEVGDKEEIFKMDFCST